MRKIGIIAMALALVLGLSQCKKEQPTTANEDETVAITLDIQNNGGTRMDVNTGTGEVTYETGDVIYVASGGTFIGTLTHNGTNFGGTITNPTVGEPLHFYFLGNVTPAETLTVGTSTSCSVVISDQTEHLPVIEYAPSNETYMAGATTFSAHLLNKCALVKFNVTTSSEAATCILSMNNKVTVDFTTNEFAYSQDGEGEITLPAGSGEQWAILLPQEEVTEAEAQASDGSYTGTCSIVPAIAENDYLTEGIAVIIETSIGLVGIINGAFTINANGDQVFFSQGNLQYQASTNKWRFAEHQYDYVGSTNSVISQTNSSWIDLFGWGTSGYNHGANAYQPWSISTNDSDYYAYGAYTNDLNDCNGQADWGYNAISNGGNVENSGWRTLSGPEWRYVINTRSTASGIRWAPVTVNGVYGVVLLPDNWTASTYALSCINGDSSYGHYDNNTIIAADWTNTLEANGAVFLPAAGYRLGTSVYNVGNIGCYWSVSYGFSDRAYSVDFYGPILNADYNEYAYRNEGRSVRLVRDKVNNK